MDATMARWHGYRLVGAVFCVDFAVFSLRFETSEAMNPI